MALVLKDRVRESSTSTGTGSFALLGTLPGFQPFSALGVGNTTYYTITGPEGTWETGLGTLTAASTLARTTVLESSNGGAAVNFTAGVKDVFVSGPGSKFFVPEYATQAQAEAGTDNSAVMTSLRTKQQTDAQKGIAGGLASLGSGGKLAAGQGYLEPIGAAINAAGTAAVDLILSDSYEDYVVVITGLRPSVNAAAYVRFATTGTTFLTTGYESTLIDAAAGTSTRSLAGETNAGEITLTSRNTGSAPLSPVAGSGGLSGRLSLVRNPAAGVRRMRGDIAYYSAVNLRANVLEVTGFHNLAAVWSALRIFPSTGTWAAGSVQLYGVAKP